MKCITVSIFRDKNDGTIYREGDELELTKKRLQEINSTDAGILVTEVAAELSEDDEKKQDETTTSEESTEGKGESLVAGAGGA